MPTLSDAIERARIGAFVHDHRQGTPFHLPGWSVAVARGCNQRAHYLVAERASGELAGVLPLTEVHSALFGRVLVSAGFGVGGGILAEDAAAVAPLAEAAWQLAGRLNCPTLEFRGGPRPGPEWEAESTTYIGFLPPARRRRRGRARTDSAQAARRGAQVARARSRYLDRLSRGRRRGALCRLCRIGPQPRHSRVPADTVFRGFAGVWQIRRRAYSPSPGSASVERIESLLEWDRLSLLGRRGRARRARCAPTTGCISS